ncbi:MAG TPA: DnaA/Hda family protein [bacterium]|nr:DnaA/Hda family protein [bacterium]
MLNSQQLYAKFTFDNFIIGKNNKVSQKYALFIADNPGKYFNLLYIYGKSGTGKTHLLNATVNYLQKKSPDILAQYLTAAEFTEQFVHSLCNKKTAEFKEGFDKIKVLLIDDFQFFSGKQQTQEVLLLILNSLYYSGCQIIISSDRKPEKLISFNDSLISWIKIGLQAEIKYPKYKAKLKILKQFAKFKKCKIKFKKLKLLADCPIYDIRELEGKFNETISLKKRRCKLYDKKITR